MANQIMLPRDVDLGRVTYGSIRNQDNGGKMMYLAYNRNPIIIQTPELPLPYGLNTWSAEKGGAPEKYSIDMSFKGYETREPVARFLELMKGFDRKLVQDAFDNSMAWFKKKHSTKDVVEALYTPIVKYARDRMTGEITDRFPPTVKLSLPRRDGRFMVEAYDARKQPLDLTALELKGARVTALIQCVGVWVAGGKFGCSWKAVQLRIVPPATLHGYAFKDAEDDGLIEEDIEEDAAGGARPAVPASVASARAAIAGVASTAAAAPPTATGAAKDKDEEMLDSSGDEDAGLDDDGLDDDLDAGLDEDAGGPRKAAKTAAGAKVARR